MKDEKHGQKTRIKKSQQKTLGHKTQTKLEQKARTETRTKTRTNLDKLRQPQTKTRMKTWVKTRMKTWVKPGAKLKIERNSKEIGMYYLFSVQILLTTLNIMEYWNIKIGFIMLARIPASS